MVIEADHYREEEKTLKEDPIIKEMAKVIPAGFELLDKPDFTTIALNEYTRRGGNKHHSIGGPARAIRALVKERE